MNNGREQKMKIAVIGLGYVGFPLLFELSKKFSVIGFDVNSERVSELNNNIDVTGEVAEVDIARADLKFTLHEETLSDCDVYIITVPTPINTNREPDMSFIKSACVTVANLLNQGDLVIFESTVYPGATENFCKPIIEKISGLKHGVDFYLGYSPERINPGDKINTLTNVKKVVSGCCEYSRNRVDKIYSAIVTAGTYVCNTISAAEAAKILENTQRDVNIALMNEFHHISHTVGFDFYDALAAAKTKWNFLHFYPGLVGGHCIGIDPYYIISESLSSGFDPSLIKAARMTNEDYPKRMASKVIKYLISQKTDIYNSRTLILGATFKPNCPDVRNTKVLDFVLELKSFGLEVDIYDPIANCEYLHDFFVYKNIPSARYSNVILTVEHIEFTKNPMQFQEILDTDGLFIDLRNTDMKLDKINL